MHFSENDVCCLVAVSSAFTILIPYSAGYGYRSPVSNYVSKDVSVSLWDWLL